MGKVCRYTNREQREREHARTRPPGDPERGEHPGPEKKRTTPPAARSPARRPGDRERPGADRAVVIVVTTA